MSSSSIKRLSLLRTFEACGAAKRLFCVRERRAESQVVSHVVFQFMICQHSQVWKVVTSWHHSAASWTWHVEIKNVEDWIFLDKCTTNVTKVSPSKVFTQPLVEGGSTLLTFQNESCCPSPICDCASLEAALSCWWWWLWSNQWWMTCKAGDVMACRCMCVGGGIWTMTLLWDLGELRVCWRISTLLF